MRSMPYDRRRINWRRSYDRSDDTGDPDRLWPYMRLHDHDRNAGVRYRASFHLCPDLFRLLQE